MIAPVSTGATFPAPVMWKFPAVFARPLFRMCRGAWAGNGQGHRGLSERAILGPEFG